MESQPQPPVVTKKASPVPIILLTVLLLLSLGFSAFLYYQNLQLIKQISIFTSPTNNQVPQPTVLPQVTQPIDPTISWQTSTNSSMQYALKLPATWKVIEHSSNFQDNESYESSTGQRIDISLRSISPLNCKGDCPVITKQTPTTLQGNTATQIDGYVGAIGGNIPHEYITITMPYKNKYLTITYNPSTDGEADSIKTITITEPEKELFYQILSTFTLTGSPAAAWQTKALALYKINLSLPADWTLTEFNRRPEPTGPEGPVKGHDCADYRITSADKTTTLTIKPICGFGDGGSDLWPADAVIVNTKTPPNVNIRYWNQAIKAYSYADASNSEGTGGTPEGKMHTSPPVVVLGSGQDLTFLTVSLTLSGSTDVNKADVMAIADKIVASMEQK